MYKWEHIVVVFGQCILTDLFLQIVVALDRDANTGRWLVPDALFADTLKVE
jgi:hypothetical protein